MLVRKYGLFALFMGAALPAMAQSAPVVDARGNAQCLGTGTSLASFGQLSTPLANRFWSHAGCGFAQEAQRILQSQRPAPASVAAPRIGAGTPLSRCYERSFPSLEMRDGRLEGGSGIVRMDRAELERVSRILLGACLRVQ